MKTLTKKEAMIAYANGEKVEFMHGSGSLAKWIPVELAEAFDHYETFRLALTDDDAEWLRTFYVATRSTETRLNSIADRIERDKARIAELEKMHGNSSDPARPDGTTCARLRWWKKCTDSYADKVESQQNKIAELEAEVERITGHWMDATKMIQDLILKSRCPAKGGGK